MVRAQEMQIAHASRTGRRPSGRKRGSTNDDCLLEHQQQMGAAAHLVDGHLWPLKYWTCANCTHETRRCVHAVRLQDDMSHGNGGALFFFTHLRVSPTSPLAKMVPALLRAILEGVSGSRNHLHHPRFAREFGDLAAI